MEYPLISEYRDAIISAEDNFNELSSLRPVLDNYGDPVMSSGNFAVVFKMRDENDGKLYAVKCFIKDQEGRDESYRKIADELETVPSSYILPLRYLEKELFVDTDHCQEEEFPVVVMEWVEGETLDAYLNRNLHDKYELEMLSYRFNRMAAWLLAQPFAHGDLKPDNILVRKDGSLVLVDYDGMFVPSMKGEKAREIGSPDYRHPSRTDADFNEHIDDFSITVIALSLKAIAINPSLKSQMISSDVLLFKESDFCKPSSSTVLKKILNINDNQDLLLLLGAFNIALAKNSLNFISFHIFLTEKPIKPHHLQKSMRQNLDTTVYENDLCNGVGDEFGGIYSENGKRLLKFYSFVRNYKIKDTCEVICDKAFAWSSLDKLFIPNSVKSIGNGAFEWSSIQTLTMPSSLTSMISNPFVGCELKIDIDPKSKFKIIDSLLIDNNGCLISCIDKYIREVTIPTSVITIGRRAFEYCSSLCIVNFSENVKVIGDEAFAACSDLYEVNLSQSVEIIGNSAFLGCYRLRSIDIPTSVHTIGDNAFGGCSNLKKLTIPFSVGTLGSNPFMTGSELIITLSDSEKFKIIDGLLIDRNGRLISCLCRNSKKVAIPKSVTSIGDYAFDKCTSLESVHIPETVKTIGQGAFSRCSNLKTLTLPSTMIFMGINPFEYCDSLGMIISNSPEYKIINGLLIDRKGRVILCINKNLTNVSIPDFITSIDQRAFYGCRFLQSVFLSKSVCKIGKGAFDNCSSLINVNIPESIKEIDDEVFNNCSSLQHVVIPNSVMIIGKSAFYGCAWLQELEIPSTVKIIKERAFQDCQSLKNISIPNSTNVINDYSFFGCRSLQKVTIPKSVKTIGRSAFENCSSLNGLTIQNSVTSIGDFAFGYCSALQSVIIPESVISIGGCAFFCCRELSYVRIPYSVATIGSQAFDGCWSLRNVFLPNPQTHIDSHGFSSECVIETNAT